MLYVAVLAYWIRWSESPVLRRLAWGSCGGSVTGAQNFLKDGLTVLKAARAASTPVPPLLYILLASAGATALLGLLILTACMKRYDATYSAASFVGSFVVSASVMAAVHYDTFASLEGGASYALYPLGLAVLMVGVYQLVGESREAGDDDDDDDVDVVMGRPRDGHEFRGDSNGDEDEVRPWHR